MIFRSRPSSNRATQPPSRAAQHTSLPRIAGLDGIRAVAVAVVVLYHLDFSWMPGGFLGVEVFFVVSGYLITSLLLKEYEGSLADGGQSKSGQSKHGKSKNSKGTISLRRFWARRARRLLPALAMLLLGVMAFVAASFTEEFSDLWDQVVAAALYVTNWLLIFQDQSYFETFGRPEVLQHLWSLAIEEQFYLLWPVVFLGGMRWLRHRWFAVVIAIGVLTSTAAMWLLYEPLEDPSRIYYGTDTRAAGLLLGALVAFVWRPQIVEGRTRFSAKRSSQATLPGFEAVPDGGRPPRWLIWVANIVGPAALAGIVGWCLYLGEFDDRLYQGGFLLLSATTALLIMAIVVPGTWFGRAMDCAPLRWLGVRSYAIYLWHWPVLVFTRPRFDVTLDGWQLHLVRIGATLVLSDLSYRFIENPIRTRQFTANLRHWAKNTRKTFRGYLLPLGAAAALALTVAVIIIPQVPRLNDQPVSEAFILTVSESDRQILVGSSSPVAENSTIAETITFTPTSVTTPEIPQTSPPSPSSSSPSPSSSSSSPSPPPASSTASPTPPASEISAPSTSPPPTTSPPSTTPSTTSPPPTTPTTSTPPPTPPTTPTAAQEDAVFRATLPSGLPDPRPFAPPPSNWGDTEPTITAFGDNITIDAEVSRQFSKLPETIANYKSTPDNPPLGDVVIIHLGTNGFLNSRVFDETMEQLETAQRVLFVNVRVPRQWEDEVNRQLARGVERWDKAFLVDWHGYSAGQEDDWITPNDGVHMVREGALAYTQLLQASI